MKLILISSILLFTFQIPDSYLQLKERFPERVKSFDRSGDPNIESVVVNGEDFYSISAYYNSSEGGFLSFRVDDYAKDPGFISKMIETMKMSPKEFEDDASKTENFQILGLPSQVILKKKYGNYEITTLINESDRQWLISVTTENISSGTSIELVEQMISALTKK